MFRVLDDDSVSEHLINFNVYNFSDTSRPIELFVPPVSESQMMQLKLEARFGADSQDSDSTPSYVIDNTQNVYVEARPWITFIQSDKELYLPGQLIRFRILSVTPDLRPSLEPVINTE